MTRLPEALQDAVSLLTMTSGTQWLVRLFAFACGAGSFVLARPGVGGAAPLLALTAVGALLWACVRPDGLSGAVFTVSVVAIAALGDRQDDVWTGVLLGALLVSCHVALAYAALAPQYAALSGRLLARGAAVTVLLMMAGLVGALITTVVPTLQDEAATLIALSVAVLGGLAATLMLLAARRDDA